MKFIGYTRTHDENTSSWLVFSVASSQVDRLDCLVIKPNVKCPNPMNIMSIIQQYYTCPALPKSEDVRKFNKNYLPNDLRVYISPTYKSFSSLLFRCATYKPFSSIIFRCTIKCISDIEWCYLIICYHEEVCKNKVPRKS